jgi:galactokinase/mevalonate kinase-like predicted kinase
MNEETLNRKKLHKSVLPPKVERIMKKGMVNGAIGAKILGSGSGGSVLFYGNKDRLKKKFKKSVMDFKFDFKGLSWV